MYERPLPKDNFDDVGEFHHKFGLHSVTHLGSGPTEVPSDLLEFRIKFMIEELTEFMDATGFYIDDDGEVARCSTPEIDDAQAFDALLDLVYVAMGTAHFMGYPWQHGWRRVQAANISKVRAQSDGSDSKRGSSFDVVKPPGWRAPNIAEVLRGHGWNIEVKENA